MGDRQVRRNIHTSRRIELKKKVEIQKRSLDVDGKLFFKLFEESNLKGSRAAARKMKKIAKRQTKLRQKSLLIHSLYFLIRSSNSEMLSWPNSPLLVLFQFVDPSVLFGNEEMSVTLLHHFANLADPFDYSTHVNQLILAKQLIEHGANVNALSSPHGMSPLHSACHGDNVTNLDFVEFLLEEGADPNAQDHQTGDANRARCSRCGEISAELAYHGRQYYRAIWRVFPSHGSQDCYDFFRQSCAP
jgi:hypothetical protein